MQPVNEMVNTVRINTIDQQKIDVAIAALSRVGITSDIAKRIAYEAVADRLERNADNQKKYARHIDGPAYRQELGYIDELRERARHLRNQVQSIAIDDNALK
ncbi:MAG: hypothetical protein ABW152_18030 [Candidatus Thiodiazotropha endolucinida]